MLFWYVTVWEGINEVDHLFFNGNDKQDDVVQYMLERVYGEKRYSFTEDMIDGDDVIIDHTQGSPLDVEIYATNHIPDISIQRKVFNLIQDLDYCPHKMTVTEERN